MYLPIELQQIIKEYSMPLTRADWRQGCFFSITFPFFEYLIHSTSRDYKIRRIVRNFGVMYHAFYLMDMYEDEDEVIL